MEKDHPPILVVHCSILRACIADPFAVVNVNAVAQVDPVEGNLPGHLGLGTPSAQLKSCDCP